MTAAWETADDYSTYLRLDLILDAQRPLSEHHDEMLFIVVHQATELWMKLIIHEVEYAQRNVAADELGPAVKALARVVRTFEVMTWHWQVLSTMTPADYLMFRSRLGSASGLQSVQYRAIEILFGRRRPSILRRHPPDERAYLHRLSDRPSLYDEVVALLGRRGFEVGPVAWGKIEPRVVDAWLTVYRDPDSYWDLYELGEKLLDVEHAFSRWRFEHFQTVRRIIGRKRGTGGTSGLDYLRRAVDHVYFPELWEVRTRL
jgi:tryptophan 2,3-dioxygenase